MFTKKTPLSHQEGSEVHMILNPHLVTTDLLIEVIKKKNKRMVAFLSWVKPDVLIEPCKRSNYQYGLSNVGEGAEDMYIFISKLASWFFPNMTYEKIPKWSVYSYASSITKKIDYESERELGDDIPYEKSLRGKIAFCAKDLNEFIKQCVVLLKVWLNPKGFMPLFPVEIRTRIIDLYIACVSSMAKNLFLRVYQEWLPTYYQRIDLLPEEIKQAESNLSDKSILQTLSKINLVHNAIAFINDCKTTHHHFFGRMAKDSKNLIANLEALVKYQPENILVCVENFIKTRFKNQNFSEDVTIPRLLKHQLIAPTKLQALKGIVMVDDDWACILDENSPNSIHSISKS